MKRAEELGYARAWFYDTQLLNADMFVAMAAAAMQTATIRLTTGVLIPSNRIAAVAASALASLNALATGRIDFGISTGFTARRSMGLGPVKLADMKEYIRIVRGLLAGDTLEWDFGEKRRKIRFLNPEIGAFNVTDPVPLHIPALGPRGRKLTAELGAGWIFTAANVAFAKAAVADMLSAWKSTGIDPAVRVATAFTGGRVLKDGEPYDSPRVKAPSDEKVARLRPSSESGYGVCSDAGGGKALPSRRPWIRSLRRRWTMTAQSTAVRVMTRRQPRAGWLKTAHA